MIINKGRLKTNYYWILDRILVEFDRRFTVNDMILNIASEKFIDITNLDNFANCYSNHVDDVVLSSQVLVVKACVASLAESSVNTNLQTIVLIYFYNTFSNLSAIYSEILKLFQIVLTLSVFPLEMKLFSVLGVLRWTCVDKIVV